MLGDVTGHNVGNCLWCCSRTSCSDEVGGGEGVKLAKGHSDTLIQYQVVRDGLAFLVECLAGEEVSCLLLVNLFFFADAYFKKS